MIEFLIQLAKDKRYAIPVSIIAVLLILGISFQPEYPWVEPATISESHRAIQNSIITVETSIKTEVECNKIGMNLIINKGWIDDYQRDVADLELLEKNPNFEWNEIWSERKMKKEIELGFLEERREFLWRELLGCKHDSVTPNTGAVEG